MSEHLEKSIGELKEKVEQQERALAATKRAVNVLCEQLGIEPVYEDIENHAPPPVKPPTKYYGGGQAIRRDAYFNKPVATAIRLYLETRKDQGPATVDEIYEALKAGGFEFSAKDIDAAKRGLQISMGKNTAVFRRLPDGETFGLAVWYGNEK